MVTEERPKQETRKKKKLMPPFFRCLDCGWVCSQLLELDMEERAFLRAFFEGTLHVRHFVGLKKQEKSWFYNAYLRKILYDVYDPLKRRGEEEEKAKKVACPETFLPEWSFSVFLAGHEFVREAPNRYETSISVIYEEILQACQVCEHCTCRTLMTATTTTTGTRMTKEKKTIEKLSYTDFVLLSVRILFLNDHLFPVPPIVDNVGFWNMYVIVRELQIWKDPGLLRRFFLEAGSALDNAYNLVTLCDSERNSFFFIPCVLVLEPTDVLELMERDSLPLGMMNQIMFKTDKVFDMPPAMFWFHDVRHGIQYLCQPFLTPICPIRVHNDNDNDNDTSDKRDKKKKKKQEHNWISRLRVCHRLWLDTWKYLFRARFRDRSRDGVISADIPIEALFDLVHELLGHPLAFLRLCYEISPCLKPFQSLPLTWSISHFRDAAWRILPSHFHKRYETCTWKDHRDIVLPYLPAWQFVCGVSNVISWINSHDEEKTRDYQWHGTTIYNHTDDSKTKKQKDNIQVTCTYTYTKKFTRDLTPTLAVFSHTGWIRPYVTCFTFDFSPNGISLSGWTFRRDSFFSLCPPSPSPSSSPSLPSICQHIRFFLEFDIRQVGGNENEIIIQDLQSDVNRSRPYLEWLSEWAQTQCHPIQFHPTLDSRALWIRHDDTSKSQWEIMWKTILLKSKLSGRNFCFMEKSSVCLPLSSSFNDSQFLDWVCCPL